MKAEDVMKALECCSKHPMKCKACPYQGMPCCTNEHRKDALALLREKDAEIERQRSIFASVCIGDFITSEQMEELRMADTLPGMHGDPVGERGCCGTLRECIADNVSKIKTRFAMRYGTYTDKDMTPITEVFRLLDQIAKEMLEGNKCSSDVKENCKYYGSDGVELSEEWLVSREIIVKSADGYGYT